jgi:hypothetical protein
MSIIISRRGLLSTGLAAVGATLATSALAAEKSALKTADKNADKSKVKADDAGKAPAKTSQDADDSQLSVEALGNLLEAMGLKPNKFETSFNFTFPFKAETEWNMAMTATMSQDEQGIWITAWLAELPQSAADVPRTALLRLLAQNDELGGGIFFAYMPKVRKIVLECMIANEDIDSASFKECLRDLATRVSETQQFWDVAEWKKSPASGTGKDSASDDKASGDQKPAALSGAGTKDARPIKTAAKDAAGGSSANSKKK